TELPGILNWALDGLKRLTIDNGNAFTRVASADEAIIAMRDLASPTAAFVRARCETGTDKEIEVDALYDAFKIWCEDNNETKNSKSVFGRNLVAGQEFGGKLAHEHGSRCWLEPGSTLDRGSKAA